MSSILDIIKRLFDFTFHSWIWRQQNVTNVTDYVTETIENYFVEPEIDETEWTPLTLTFVEYPKDDFLGFVYAVLSLLPVAVCLSLFTLVLFRRDLWTITFLGNLVLDEGLNKILKRIIKSPRPMERKDTYGEYGMPSSHAQFMGFFTVYLILFICLRQKQTYRTSIAKLVRSLLVLMLVFVNALVCISRVYLSYHTMLQVVVGQILGITLGSTAFFMVIQFLVPLFPTVVSWRISEYFLIRDTTVIPNVVLFEYVIIRQETRARLRQSKKKANQ